MTCEKQYKFFETIAHKSRWRILELLASGPKNVTEIAKALNEEQSKVSHSLKKLLECNVVTATQIGKQRRYYLNKDTILPIIQLAGKHVEKHCKVCTLK
tara:strand:- start:208 stop:504 length:297 start_codon:yes stop_codon:yes gene_type:complete